MVTEVHLPDGTVAEFPDGTDPDTMQRAVSSYSQKIKADKFWGGDASKAGVFMKALGGAKHSLDSAAMGVKGLVTDLTPEDKANLDQGKAFIDEVGGWGTAGGIGGEMLATGGPAGKMLKGAAAVGRMLPQAIRAARGMSALGTTAAVAGTGATMGAITSPEDRAGGAEGGALGSVLGQAAGKVLSKVGGGIARGLVSPDGQALIGQGIDVPLWKATDNKLIRNIAEGAKVLPVVKTIMKSQERKAMEQFNSKLIEQATPPTPVLDQAGNVLRWQTSPVTEIGQEGIRALKDRFGKAYDSLYNGRTVPLDPAFEADLKNVSSSTRRYKPSIADDVDGAIAELGDTIRPGTQVTPTSGLIVGTDGQPLTQGTDGGHAGVTYDAIRRARQMLDARVKSAWGSGDAEKATAMELVRSALNGVQNRALPPEVQAMKAPVDAAYSTFKRLERAGDTLGVAKQDGVMTPAQVLNASKAIAPSKGMIATGTAPLQQQAQQAHSVLGSDLPEVGPGTAEKIAIGGLAAGGLASAISPYIGVPALAFTALSSKTGQRGLMGQLPGQATIRSKQDAITAALRSYGMAEGQQE